MKNVNELREAFNKLSEGQQIKIDNGIYNVVESHKDDCVFLQNVENESNTFHIFHDEIDPETDQFEVV